MNSQERMRAAKESAAAALEPALGAYDRIGEFQWATLVDTGESEEWVVFSMTCKKQGFDIDEAIEAWDFQRKEMEEKRRAASTKKQGKTGEVTPPPPDDAPAT